MNRPIRHGIGTRFALCCALAATGASAGSDPLAELEGAPAIIDFPDLDSLGRQLRVPAGWGYLHVTAENFVLLSERIGVKTVPALVFLDRYGNALHSDTAAGSRERVKPGVAEFERRRKELEEGLAKLAEQARDAREGGRDAAEVARIVDLADLPWKGYPELETARARRDELDGLRRRELLRILAGEGIATSARLATQLRELEPRARGLRVAHRIALERQRLERGEVVDTEP